LLFRKHDGHDATTATTLLKLGLVVMSRARRVFVIERQLPHVICRGTADKGP
jgi:predicted mannosyl-3-phosphoglycerate phosphatase (HAD superfamily)